MRNVNNSVKDRLSVAMRVIGDCKVDLVTRKDELTPLYKKRTQPGLF